jgi:hypothetical protein
MEKKNAVGSTCIRMDVYLYIYEYTDMHFVGASTVGRILFIFDIQEFIHRISVTEEYEHFSYKNMALKMGFKTLNCVFLEFV